MQIMRSAQVLDKHQFGAIALFSIAQISIAPISIAQISIAQISIAQISIAQMAIAPLVFTLHSGVNVLFKLLCLTKSKKMV